jgi:SAM-dependent methyltransferase
MKFLSPRENLSPLLRDAGLNPRALAAWAGTDRLSALPATIPSLVEPTALVLPPRREPKKSPAATPPPERVVPSADPPTSVVAPPATSLGRPHLPSSPTLGGATLALFVAGASIRRERLQLLAGALPELAWRGWITGDDIVSATVAILPLGTSLIVCDRLDTPVDTNTVSWPDDSSYHLARALPRGKRWLDLGCGSGFAPLLRREIASEIVGVELNPRAARYAAASAELSGVDHFAVTTGDLTTATGQFDLISCNAPIPGDASPACWRRADDGFFDRLWDVCRACAAPYATIVVHGVLSALRVPLPGERIIVDYTPDASFGVLWWCPDAPDRLVIRHRALTPERPHVDASDIDQ